METTVESRAFQIKVEYDPSVGDPRRVFKSMISYIDALDSAGAEFVKGIDPDLTFDLGLQKTTGSSLISDLVGWVRPRKKKIISPRAQEAVVEGLRKAEKAIADSQSTLGPSGQVDMPKVLEQVRQIQKDTGEKYYELLNKHQKVITVQEFSEKKMNYIMSKLAAGTLLMTESNIDKAYITIGQDIIEMSKNIQPKAPEPEILAEEIQTKILTDPSLGPWKISIDVIHYSSGSGWVIIYDGKKYPATMADENQLEKLQAQEDVLGARDQLLVLAKFTATKGSADKIRSHCEIIEVLKKYNFSPEPRLIEDLDE